MIDNLALYRYFFEVAKAGSISAAAKKLYVSQPAVSAMIGNLEKELHTVLFFRTSRGIALTPEGRVLFDYVKNAFSFLEAGEDKLLEFSGLAGGELRIGASDMTLKFFLLDYIEKFHQDHPGIHLSVTNAPTPQTLSALKGGNIDLCVVSGPLSELEHLVSLPVKEIQDVFVASPSFRPESTPLSFEELSEFPLIMLEKTTSTRAYVDQHIRSHCRADKLPRPTIELATSDLVLEFAKRGIGIGSMVRDFAADALQKGELYELSLACPPPPRTFCLVYPENLPLSAAAKSFLASILSENRK